MMRLTTMGALALVSAGCATDASLHGGRAQAKIPPAPEPVNLQQATFTPQKLEYPLAILGIYTRAAIENRFGSNTVAFVTPPSFPAVEDRWSLLSLGTRLSVETCSNAAFSSCQMVLSNPIPGLYALPASGSRFFRLAGQ